MSDTGVDVGVIQGGWEFVTAAYAVSAVIIGIYAVSVLARYRAEVARRNRRPPNHDHPQP